MRSDAIRCSVYPPAPMPVLLDLPGPSRRIRVEPLRLPTPAQQPARGPEPEREPAPVREPEPAREPAPA
jgi:hypothetical protein